MRERERLLVFILVFSFFWSYFLEYFSSLFYFTQGYVERFYFLSFGGLVGY